MDDIDKHIKECESERDMEELQMEMQVVMNSIVTDFNKEIQALRMSKATKDGEINLTGPRSRLARLRPSLARQ